MTCRIVRPDDPATPVPDPADRCDWLPPDYAVFRLSDLADALDLSAITAVDDRGTVLATHQTTR